MNFEKILQQTAQCGDELLADAKSIVQARQYCAQAQVYRHYLSQNRERAELYRNNFKEFNDKIFRQAIEIVDAAIENADTELARSAMDTIEIMKKQYPDFYAAYFKQLFGRK